VLPTLSLLFKLMQLICGVLRSYYHGIREARPDIDCIFAAIKGLKDVLVRAEKIMNLQVDAETLQVNLSSQLGPLKGELEKLQSQLGAPKDKG
jgi:hypothetical protein